MIFSFICIIVLYAIYLLFLDGVLWKGILFFAGWFGLRFLLPTYIPETAHTTIIFNHPVTWAAVIATGVCFMALLTTRE